MFRLITPLLLFLLAGCGKSTPAGHPTERAANAFNAKYEKHLAKVEPNLKYLYQDFLWDQKIHKFGGHFMYRGELKASDAKEMFKKFAADFINESRKSKTLEKHLLHSPLPINDYEFVVSFWDAETERPKKPHVAQMRMKGDTLSLYYKQETSEALESEPAEMITLDFPITD
ncbi:MAG: hypothetical protein P0S94_00875 [Simkaniaceae bacterium]|nr:hypothetical protein [Simkaniaceae bacterium]